MRRHHLVAITALAALAPAGAAVATAPPDTTAATDAPAPPDTGAATEPASSDAGAATSPPEGTASTGDSTPTGDSTTPATAGEVTVFDDEGTEVATIAVSATEPAWTDYGDDDTPEEGREYLRVTVTVTSLVAEGTFGVAIDDFVLQDAHGFLDTADNVPTAEQAENDEEIVEEADLANGESVELALTFEVDPTIGGESVFYHPDEDRLVDVTEVA